MRRLACGGRPCRCLNSGNRSLAGGESKMDVFRRYRFCIAMENTVAHDYVTEKLWDAFAAGCVPIYYVRHPTAAVSFFAWSAVLACMSPMGHNKELLVQRDCRPSVMAGRVLD